MASAKKNESVNYVSKTATVEEIVKFLLNDDRQAFASLKLLGEGFLQEQSEEMLKGFVSAAAAWQPTMMEVEQSILIDYAEESVQYRKSATAPIEKQLTAEGVNLPENAAFIKHHVSFSFYVLTDKKENELEESNSTASYLETVRQALVDSVDFVVRQQQEKKIDGNKVSVLPCGNLPEKTAEEQPTEEQPTAEESKRKISLEK